MNKTLQEKLELGLKVSEKMIADMEDRLQDAIEHENWTKAADLKSYINGMDQIIIIFLAIKPIDARADGYDQQTGITR